MPLTVSPTPRPLPAATATGPPPPTPRQAAPAADRPHRMQASPQVRRPAADPRPRLDHPQPIPPPATDPPPTFHPRPEDPRRRSPESSRRRRPGPEATGPPAADPTPKAQEHTPRGPFLHPSPVGSGTSPRHQPHKIARSARSAIPRRITSANPAPVTAPFLRLPCHHLQSQSPPFYRLQCTALRYPRR